MCACLCVYVARALHNRRQIMAGETLEGHTTHGNDDFFNHLGAEVFNPAEFIGRPHIAHICRRMNRAPDGGECHADIGIHQQFRISRHIKRELGFLRHSEFLLAVEINSKLLKTEIRIFKIGAFEEGFFGVAIENHILVASGNEIQ